jgi:peptidyl-prolyl cis-trans isomerase C
MQFKPFKSLTTNVLLGLIVTLALGAGIISAQPVPSQQTPITKGTQPPTTPPPVLQSATKSNEPPLFPKDMVVMTIGDRKFTVADFNRLMEIFPAQQRTYYSGPGRRKFAEDFSQLIILADEAKRQKLMDDPIIRERISLLTDQSLAQSMIQKVQDNIKIPDADVQKYFSDHIKDYDEVKASHILIRVKDSPAALPPGKKDLTDEEARAKANEIYKAVSQPGADFAAIAKAESYDQGSGARGGDLGNFKRGQMIPPFEAAVFSMKPGEISEPIKTPFGYHIIRLENRKSQTVEQARGDIENILRRERVEKEMDSIKKSVKVDLNDQFFPVPPPPVTPTTAPPPKPPSPPAEKKD